MENTVQHVCQHTDIGEDACSNCHEPKRVPAAKRVPTRTPSRRTGKDGHRTPALLRAAMKANAPERLAAAKALVAAGLARIPSVAVPNMNQYLYLA